MSDTRKIIEGLTLLKALIRLNKLERDTTDEKEKIGIAKAGTILADLGVEIMEAKPDETVMP